jgi:putative hydrolase of the HAD superfamily
MRVRAVLFDIDDTLYDHMQWLRGAFLRVGRLLEAKFGLSGEVVRDTLLSIAEVRTSAAGDLFDVLLEWLGVPGDGELIGEMVEAFYSHRPERLEPYPGVRETLTTLREERRRTGIVSDGREEVQLHKLEALGLADLFDVVVISDAYGRKRRKPSAFPYLLALEKLGVRAGESVYVGDNPNKDFIGARRIGMRTIRVLLGEYRNVRREPEWEADFEVRSPAEILETIRKIERSA